MNPSNQILPDTPGHALIAIRPLAHECCQVSLNADPLHFPPNCVDRIITSITELLQFQVEARPKQTGPWTPPTGPLLNSENSERNDRFAPLRSGRRDQSGQRILVSLIIQSGWVHAELAHSNVDPAVFSADEIDWLVSRLNNHLNETPLAKRPFVSGRN